MRKHKGIKFKPLFDYEVKTKKHNLWVNHTCKRISQTISVYISVYVRSLQWQIIGKDNVSDNKN